MLKLRPKRRSVNKIEEKETTSSKRKKTKSESENEFDEEEEAEDFDSPMDNTDEDSDYNPTKEKAKSSSSEEENGVETESNFFRTNSFGVRKKPPWYKLKTSPSTSQVSSFKSPATKQRTLFDSDSSSDEFERVPDSLDDLGGFERLNKEVKKEDSEGEMESDSKVTEYFDFSQIIQNQEVLKAAAIKKEKDPSVLPSKRVKQRSAGNKKIKNSSNDDDVMKLLALGEGAELGSKKDAGESDSDDDDDDYEETDEMKAEHSKPKGVEVTIAFPSQNQHKKKDKKASDVEAALKRRFNLIKKENQIFAHKVHLLCWIAHGNHLNSILNCEDLMGIALSIIPSNYCYPPKRCDLTYLENFVKWFREKIKIDPVLGKDVIRPDRIVTSHRLQEQFNKQMANSRLDQVLLFIATLRALGLLVRLIINLRPVPLKPPVKELFTFKSSQESDTGSKSGKSKKIEVKKEVVDKDLTKKEDKSVKKVSEKNTESKENEKSSSSPEITKRSSKRNVDENKKVDSCSSEVIKRSSKRNVKKEDLDEVSNNLDDKEPCSKDEPPEDVKQDKTRSKASSKSKLDEDVDKSTNVEENVTRRSNRTSNVVKTDDSTNENSNSGKTSTRSSRNSSKLVEKVATTPKSNKVPDEGSVNATEKKGRTRSVSSSLKKIDDKSDVNKNPERGSRSRSMSSKNTKEVDADAKQKSSKSTSKYFENKVETPINNVNGYEDAEERGGRGKRHKKNLVDSLKEVESSDDEGEEDTNKKKKTTKGKSSVSKKSEKKSTKKNTESDEEFELESSYFKSKNKIDRRVLSSDDDSRNEASKKSKKKNNTDEWAEVFLEAEEKWICVDLTKGMIHCVQQLYASATQPVTHVLGWENNKCIKDLTRRYVPHFMTVTRKQRVEDEWWTQSLRPFAPSKNARNREEDEDLDKQMEDQPLPTSISEYKNHPLYALQRHLLKFQAIYPPDAPTLGFIRNEPVYSRTCVAELHCRESWIKFAKVVRAGEEPYKTVKARPKYDKMTGEFRSDLPLPLFGPWQVDDYVPPPAKDGKVPRNEYGNVELFQPSMLPAGTVHLKLPGLNRVAKKLQIDCAAAVTGWDFHGGSSHVVFDGFVVCEEFEETLTEAWYQEQQEAEKRAREKMEQKIYGNWKRLIKGLLIREKLKLKYGFEIEEEVVAGSSGKGQKSKKGESSKKVTKK